MLQMYPNRAVADSALSGLFCHMWFFSEHLVGLAFFDDQVKPHVKNAMANNLLFPKIQIALPRRKLKNVNFNKLETFVTERINCIFKLFSTTGIEESKHFLVKDLEKWQVDSSYQKLYEHEKLLKVINDSAEREIALIEKYNQSLTKDELKKQFLLRFIKSHHQQFSSSSKTKLKI